MDKRSTTGRLVLLFVLILVVALVAAAPAWAAPLQVRGASVLSNTQVKISFNQAVDASAENPARYAITPSLAVTQAVRTEADNAVVLTTAAQTNATTYTVRVSGINGMVGGAQTATFIGTPLGPNGANVFKDDFNRPYGLVNSDVPIGGPWTTYKVDAGNFVNIAADPVFGGAGALFARVTSTNPELDNAAVSYTLNGSAGGNDYYVSAYVNVPAGQSWTGSEAVGLLRFNQTATSAHARVTAYAESANTYSIKVNWKSTGNAYYGDQVVATGVPFGSWHWIEFHVRNGSGGSGGEVEVWLDGRLAYAQDTIYVQNTLIKQVEVGIMHATTAGVPVSTLTDEVRIGTSFLPPSAITDSTSPGATLTSPKSGAVVDGIADMAATASDNVGLQRVEFLVDGNVAGSDIVAPYAYTYNATGLSTGNHSFAARAVDTSGNVTTSNPVTAFVDNRPPDIISPVVSPNPFTPNGDGSQDKTYVTYSTTEKTNQRVSIVDGGGVTVKTLYNAANVAAGAQKKSWDGTYFDAASKTNQPVADGTYAAKIEVTDHAGRVSVRTLPVTVNRVLAKVSRTPAAFSPNGDSTLETATTSYTLNGPATVTLTVETPTRVVVRTLVDHVAQAAGTYADNVWDGRNGGGAVVADGSYVIRVTAVNATGSVEVTKAIVVDTVAPVVTVISALPNPFYPSDGPLSVTYTVNESGTATFKYYLFATRVRTITKSAAAAGTFVSQWDGAKDDSSPSEAGPYTLKLYFQDKAGNRATVYPVQATFQLVR